MLGVIIAGVVLIFIFFGMVAGALSGIGEEMEGDKVEIEENSILHLKLNQPIVDQAENNPFASINIGGMDDQGQRALKDVLDQIKNAKEDENIKGIYLDLSGIPAGYATLSEVRDGLVDFKSSGKWIVSYGEMYSQKGYYMASVADEIYMYPEGGLDLRGLRAELMFFKGTLDKLGVEAQILRPANNKYKSAVEPFFRENMSDANRAQTQQFLESIWSELVADMSEARGVSEAQLNSIADSLYVTMISASKRAKELNLVDGLKHPDEVTALLKEKVEVEDDDDFHLVSFGKYLEAKEGKKSGFQFDFGKDKKKDKDEDKEDHVAVIYATGAIAGGKGGTDNIGSDGLSKTIREARKDSSVKAIVLRVNSPGGSALASDVILREVELAKAEKPVIVSMGDVAASGGYYISCKADKIFASENTITGSIGVFGMLPNMEEFFKEKMGITVDRVTTNAYSDMGSTLRPLTDFEWDNLNASVDETYRTFLGLVAEGRGMTVEEVDAIGQGRVWSGTDAKANGLVDEIGGLEEAIAYALEQAGLEDDAVEEYPKGGDPFEEFMKELTGDAKVNMVKEHLGEHYTYYEYLKVISTLEGVQMRLPFIMEVK